MHVNYSTYAISYKELRINCNIKYSFFLDKTKAKKDSAKYRFTSKVVDYSKDDTGTLQNRLPGYDTSKDNTVKTVGGYTPLGTPRSNVDQQFNQLQLLMNEHQVIIISGSTNFIRISFMIDFAKKNDFDSVAYISANLEDNVITQLIDLADQVPGYNISTSTFFGYFNETMKHIKGNKTKRIYILDDTKPNHLFSNLEKHFSNKGIWVLLLSPEKSTVKEFQQIEFSLPEAEVTPDTLEIENLFKDYQDCSDKMSSICQKLKDDIIIKLKSHFTDYGEYAQEDTWQDQSEEYQDNSNMDSSHDSFPIYLVHEWNLRNNT